MFAVLRPSCDSRDFMKEDPENGKTVHKIIYFQTGFFYILKSIESTFCFYNTFKYPGLSQEFLILDLISFCQKDKTQADCIPAMNHSL